MKFRLNICEATSTLAFGAVYGLVAFIFSLDYLIKSPTMSWTALAVFVVVTLLFAANLVLLVWSLFDPEWMRHRRGH